MTDDQQATVQAALYARQTETSDRWTARVYDRARTGIGFALHRTLARLTADWQLAAAWSMQVGTAGQTGMMAVPGSLVRTLDNRISLRPSPSPVLSCGLPVSARPGDRVKSALTGGHR